MKWNIETSKNTEKFFTKNALSKEEILNLIGKAIRYLHGENINIDIRKLTQSVCFHKRLKYLNLFMSEKFEQININGLSEDQTESPEIDEGQENIEDEKEREELEKVEGSEIAEVAEEPEVFSEELAEKLDQQDDEKVVEEAIRERVGELNDAREEAGVPTVEYENEDEIKKDIPNLS